MIAGSVNSGSMTVSYNLDSGKFIYTHSNIGTFVQNGTPIIIAGQENIYGNDSRYDKTESITDISNGKRYKIHYSTSVVGIPSQFDIIFEINGSTNEIALIIDLLGNNGSIVVEGDVDMGSEPYLGRLPGEDNHGVFSLSYGPVSSRTAKALFNRFNDSALSIAQSTSESYLYHESGTPENDYKFISSSESANLMFKIKLHIDVIRNQGNPYYSPIDKAYFPKAPAGWCTWYYYYQNINETEVINNLNWISANLKPFGLEYVQIDDGWQGAGQGMEENRDWTTVCSADFPNGMKYIADQVHDKGLKAGLWLAPHGQSNASIFTEHPNWFLRNYDGTPVPSSWEGLYLIDPTSTDMINNYWKTTLWDTISNIWGYDYFKIDGQPVVIDMYNQYQSRFSNTSINAAQAYRNTLSEIRNVVGNDKFILGCWGMPREGMDIMNGSRTYWDIVVNWREMQMLIDAIHDNNYLNNVAWWCDPDTLCVRDPLSVDEARTLTTAVALSGEILMTSDKMYDLTPDKLELLKRAYPTNDIKPMDFYPWPEARANIWNLKVAKSFGSWDVVALFNWDDDEIADRSVSFGDMGLDSSKTYLIYDFWNKSLIGEASGNLNASNIAPHACRLFTICEKTGNPQLMASSRHIAQGIIDIQDCSWNDENGRLYGISTIVGGDPYILSIYMPDGYEFDSASVDSGTYSTQVSGRLLKLIINSTVNASVNWSISFNTGAALYPGYFNLSTPESMSTSCTDAPTFVWSASSNASSYTFMLDDSPDFISPIVNTNVGNITSYTPEVSLDRMVPYYWKVTATNSVGSTEAVNNNIRFSVRLFDGQITQLSSIIPANYSQGWGNLNFDRSVDGNMLTLNGESFINGIGTHTDSSIVYNLRKQYDIFESYVGIDDEVGGNGSLVFQVWGDGIKLYDSGTMTGNSETQHISVSVSGVEKLELKVTDAKDGNSYDHADWAYAAISTKGVGEFNYISDSDWESATSEWGTIQKDLSISGQTLTLLGGFSFEKGIGTHASSDIIYDISDMGYSLFESYIGLDNEVNFEGSPASVVYQVWLDGEKVYESNVMDEDTPPEFISIDVKDHNQLKLTVKDAGDGINYDHANWAGAALIRSWAVSDIGETAAEGSAEYSKGVFTIEGSGADIWAVPDEFCYVYREMTGDGSIIVRVSSVQNTDEWAKAGVMMRETLSTNSKYADIVVTPSCGVSFQWRSITGGIASATNSIGEAPLYLKITRSGSIFAVYKSSDAENWTQVGVNTIINMNDSYYIGLAVTSHNDGILCTSIFDSVRIP